jgi:bacterioferritin-associated ferredoxin
MAPAFVFAEQIRKIVQAGKKEFDVPYGARISAAAMELIKDYGIDIHYLSSDIPGASPQREETIVTVDAGGAPVRSARAEPEEAIATEDGGPPSPEVIEDIVNRVIERFYRLKGKSSDKVELTKSTRSGGGVDPTGDNDLVICRCEEITRQEIRDTIKNGFRTLNGIKRVTRAGMGLCQGQTCQRLITQILAEELGVKSAEIEPTTARGPVRPIRLAVFANS